MDADVSRLRATSSMVLPVWVVMRRSVFTPFVQRPCPTPDVLTFSMAMMGLCDTASSPGCMLML